MHDTGLMSLDLCYTLYRDLKTKSLFIGLRRLSLHYAWYRVWKSKSSLYIIQGLENWVIIIHLQGLEDSVFIIYDTGLRKPSNHYTSHHYTLYRAWKTPGSSLYMVQGLEDTSHHYTWYRAWKTPVIIIHDTGYVTMGLGKSTDSFPKCLYIPSLQINAVLQILINLNLY